MIINIEINYIEDRGLGVKRISGNERPETGYGLTPVSGTYVMTVDEAAEAASAIKPKLAIPVHIGGPIGSLAMAEEFKKKATVPVMVLLIEK